MKKGFTIIEIMVVMSIVAILSAIAIPSFVRARDKAQAKRNGVLETDADKYLIKKLFVCDGIAMYSFYDNVECKTVHFWKVVETNKEVLQ